jgi:hypothetical protein
LLCNMRRKDSIRIINLGRNGFSPKNYRETWIHLTLFLSGHPPPHLLAPSRWYAGCRGFMRVWREASRSLWCHGTFLNIDFHGIDRGGESHGGCDWRFWSYGVQIFWLRWRPMLHMLFMCARCLVTCINSLVQRMCSTGGPPRVQSHNFHGET